MIISIQFRVFLSLGLFACIVVSADYICENGSYSNPSCWTGGSVPSDFSDVQINCASACTILIDSKVYPRYVTINANVHLIVSQLFLAGTVTVNYGASIECSTSDSLAEVSNHGIVTNCVIATLKNESNGKAFSCSGVDLFNYGETIDSLFDRVVNNGKLLNTFSSNPTPFYLLNKGTVEFILLCDTLNKIFLDSVQNEGTITCKCQNDEYAEFGANLLDLSTSSIVFGHIRVESVTIESFFNGFVHKFSADHNTLIHSSVHLTVNEISFIDALIDHSEIFVKQTGIFKGYLALNTIIGEKNSSIRAESTTQGIPSFQKLSLSPSSTLITQGDAIFYELVLENALADLNPGSNSVFSSIQLSEDSYLTFHLSCDIEILQINSESSTLTVVSQNSDYSLFSNKFITKKSLIKGTKISFPTSESGTHCFVDSENSTFNLDVYLESSISGTATIQSLYLKDGAKLSSAVLQVNELHCFDTTGSGSSGLLSLESSTISIVDSFTVGQKNTEIVRIQSMSGDTELVLLVGAKLKLAAYLFLQSGVNLTSLNAQIFLEAGGFLTLESGSVIVSFGTFWSLDNSSFVHFKDATKTNPNILDSANTFSGNGVLQFDSTLIVQKDQNNPTLVFNVNTEILSNADIILAEDTSADFPKTVLWDSGSFSASTISLSSKPRVILSGTTIISSETTSNAIDIELENTGTIQKMSGTLLLTRTHFVQSNSLFVLGSATLMSSDGTSNFEQNGILTITGSFTLGGTFAKCVNDHSGIIKINGQASLLANCENKGNISLQSTQAWALYKFWSFAQTSVLSATFSVSTQPIYIPQSGNDCVGTIGTHSICGANSHIELSGTLLSTTLAVISGHVSIQSEDENATFKLNNSKLTVNGGTVSGLAQVHSGSYIDFVWGIVNNFEVQIEKGGIVTINTFITMSEQTLSFISSLIVSSGTIAILSTELSQTDSIVTNEFDGIVSFDLNNLKKSNVEEFPIPISNDGMIELSLNTRVRVCGHCRENGKFTLSVSAELFVCEDYEFNKFSVVNGGCVVCDKKAHFSGSFFNIFRAINDCWLSEDMNDVFFDTFFVEGETVDVRKRPSVNVFVQEPNTQINIFADLIVRQSFLAKENAKAFGSNSIIVENTATFVLHKGIQYFLQIVLLGEGILYEHKNFFDKIVIGGHVDVVRNTDEDETKEHVINAVIISLCDKSVLSVPQQVVFETEGLELTQGVNANGYSFIKADNMLLTSTSICTEFGLSTETKGVMILDYLRANKYTHIEPLKHTLQMNTILHTRPVVGICACTGLCVITHIDDDLVISSIPTLENYGTSLIFGYVHTRLIVRNALDENGKNEDKQHWMTRTDVIPSTELATLEDEIEMIKNFVIEANSIVTDEIDLLNDVVDETTTQLNHFNLYLPHLHSQQSQFDSLSTESGTCFSRNTRTTKITVGEKIVESAVMPSKAERDNPSRTEEPLLSLLRGHDNPLFVILENTETSEFIQSSGTTLLNGGVFIASHGLFQGGVLTGSGSMKGNIEIKSNGIVFPRFANKKISVEGTLKLSENGVFISHIRSRINFDTLSVTTLDTNGGKIIAFFAIDLENSVELPFPNINDKFKLINFHKQNSPSKLSEHTVDGKGKLVEKWNYNENDLTLCFIGCENGFVPAAVGSIEPCVECPVNTWANVGDLECSLCPEGYHRNMEDTEGCVLDDSESTEIQIQPNPFPRWVPPMILMGFGLVYLFFSFRRKDNLSKMMIIGNRQISKKSGEEYSSLLERTQLTGMDNAQIEQTIKENSQLEDNENVEEELIDSDVEADSGDDNNSDLICMHPLNKNGNRVLSEKDPIKAQHRPVFNREMKNTPGTKAALEITNEMLNQNLIEFSNRNMKNEDLVSNSSEETTISATVISSSPINRSHFELSSSVSPISTPLKENKKQCTVHNENELDDFEVGNISYYIEKPNITSRKRNSKILHEENEEDKSNTSIESEGNEEFIQEIANSFTKVDKVPEEIQSKHNSFVKVLNSPDVKAKVKIRHFNQYCKDIAETSERMKEIETRVEQAALAKQQATEEMNTRLKWAREEARRSAEKKRSFQGVPPSPIRDNFNLSSSLVRETSTPSTPIRDTQIQVSPTSSNEIQLQEGDPGWAIARVNRIEMTNLQPRNIPYDINNPNLYFKSKQTPLTEPDKNTDQQTTDKNRAKDEQLE